jgi:hypothetical protein
MFLAKETLQMFRNLVGVITVVSGGLMAYYRDILAATGKPPIRWPKY